MTDHPKRILLVTETRQSWISKGPISKSNPEMLDKLQYFLPRDMDIYELYKEIAIAGEKDNIEVQLVRISDGQELQERIRAIIDESFIIWSISDGQIRYRGGYIPSISKTLRIPYFGSSTAVQSICSNKYISSLSLLHAGINVPWSCYADGDEILSSHNKMKIDGPFFVKPNQLGSQIGINEKSLAYSWEDALERSVEIKKEFNSRAIIQQYVEGKVIRVSYVAVGEEDKFGVNKVNFINNKGENEIYPMDSVENYTKWVFEYEGINKSNNTLARKIKDVCAKSMYSLKIKDYFGLDACIDSDGEICVFEINTSPYVNDVYLDLASRS